MTLHREGNKILLGLFSVLSLLNVWLYFGASSWNWMNAVLLVFMSPLNVHVQWAPLKGIVKYAKYHAGLFLVAWHPKSSTENERTTLVIQQGEHEILFRQIAGAVARRIRFYIKEGQSVEQGEEVGFIKFGSRVDIFLPLGAEICVNMDQKVSGKTTVLARLPK